MSYLQNPYHFPTKWQGVVFHSYAWVPSSNIAAAIGCEEETVERAAADLGLPHENFGPKLLKKSYQTVLRANYHLLPRPQLLTLLGLTEERFNKLWYEEDFLNIKLNVSGASEPVLYTPLTEEQIKQTEHIAELVRKNIVPETRKYFDFYPPPRIYNNSAAVIKYPQSAADYVEFVQKYYDLSFLAGRELILREDSRESEQFTLSADENSVTVSGSPAALLRGMQYAAENRVGVFSGTISPKFKDRIIYDYDASCSDFAVATDPPEAFLRELSFKQINGIFLHGLLRTLAPFPFDETLSEGYERRIEYLNRYIRTARKYGIRVFLYMNEPRSMPIGFFDDKPDILGTVGYGVVGAFCTSVPRVRQWITEATRCLVSRLEKDFGGFITITASENLTNCKSNFGDVKLCNRCADKSKGFLYADVNNLLYRAMISVNPGTRLIAWLWGAGYGYRFRNYFVFG